MVANDQIMQVGEKLTLQIGEWKHWVSDAGPP